MTSEHEFTALVAENGERVEELERHPALGETEQNRLKIRRAVQRFANGTTTKTDGSWTAINLAKEAELGRATIYRETYEVERQLFEKLRDIRPTSASGLREQLRAARTELKAERLAAKKARDEHQTAENALLERIHALTLLVASSLGQNGVPTLFPEFARRRKADDAA